MKANNHLYFSNFKVSAEEKVSIGFFYSVYVWMVLRRFFFAFYIAVSVFFQKQQKFVIQHNLQPTITNNVFFIELKLLNSLPNSSTCFPFWFDFSGKSFKIRQYASSHRITFLFHFCNCLCFPWKAHTLFLVFSKEIAILFKKGLGTFNKVYKVQFHLFYDQVACSWQIFIK